MTVTDAVMGYEIRGCVLWWECENSVPREQRMEQNLSWERQAWIDRGRRDVSEEW